MLRTIFGALFMATLFSCNGGSTLQIKGTVDLPNGKKVFRLAVDGNNQAQVVDTSTVENGSFKFADDLKYPEINFLQLEDQKDNFVLIAEKGTITVTLYKDSLANSKAKGTVSNDDFVAYRKETKDFVSAVNGIRNDIQVASVQGNQAAVQDLQEQYLDVQGQIKTYELDFINSHTDSFISLLILERYLQTKSLTQKEAKVYFDALSDRLKNCSVGIRLANTLAQPENPAAIGAVAPDFTGPTPEGTMLQLSQSLGKVTVLDFWASWCRPCRVENPNLVRTYNKLKDRGLKVFSVSLDRNKASWVQAIKDDGLLWGEHVSNLQYWNDPIARAYKVTAIPATFILDENGVIIARDLRGSFLEKKLEELLP
jgi:peroxiredoxin